MKNTLLLLLSLLFISVAARASFESTVPGITIANTHLLDAPHVLRGSQPLAKVAELRDYRVTDVLIFKNPTKGPQNESTEPTDLACAPEKRANEIIAERCELKAQGIRSEHIPFRWKELASNEVACRQLIAGLSWIAQVRARGGVAFFHCTVGEDRTGMLAGLWRMLDDGYTRERAWREEMCPNGYADGNRIKPAAVATAIHGELTPLFYAIARKIKQGKLSLANLDPEVCGSLQIRKVTRTCR